MSRSRFDKTKLSFASVSLALMLGACAHVGEQAAQGSNMPASAQTDAAADTAATANSTTTASTRQTVMKPVPPVIYRVRRGDSLARIAHSHGCTVKQLVAWNHLKSSARLKLGQPLRVSSPDAVKMVAVPIAPAASTSAAAPVNAAASASNGTTATSNAAASTSTSNATAPAPSPADSREVAAELSRHAKGVALSWPAQGSVVEGFQPGETRGIEIGGKAGDPVRAAADGKVMYAGTGLNEYGSLIIVQHNKDFLTAYSHNRKLLVKTGDIVRQGQQIAEMGSENNSRVSVLFELRRDGKPIDPMPFLPHSRG
jgi:lipoprotein NlpD